MKKRRKLFSIGTFWLWGGAGGAFFGGNLSVESLKVMEQELLKQGVVGFLSTVSTNDDNVIFDAIDSALSFRNLTIDTFLGLHLEGPFINSNNRGAYPWKGG